MLHVVHHPEHVTPATAGSRDQPADISAACRAVLGEPDPLAKVKAARKAARDWRAGRLAWGFATAMPDRPARTARPPLLPPSRMPKRGRAGSPRARIAMLHALAHIEYVAIETDPAAHRIFVAEVVPRERFVDDHHVRSLRSRILTNIAIVEIAPAQQRHLHRLEVVGRDEADPG